MAKSKKTTKKKAARAAGRARSARAARPKSKRSAKRAPAKRSAAAPKLKRATPRVPRKSWLDPESDKPLIERYSRQLQSFLEALADGIVDEGELRAQEKRLVKLMKDVEPQLDDALHEKVTQMLCELTAYDLMQVLHSMHEARPRSQFRG